MTVFNFHFMYLFFFAPVKDDKKLTDIMLSKVGCSDYVSMLNKRGIGNCSY